MTNKKNLFALIISLTFILSTLVYFIIPIKGVLPGSYKDFNNKTAQALEINDKKETLSLKLNGLREDIKTKEDELSKVNEASEKSKELFTKLLDKQKNGGDWRLHVPSLLIELENAAFKRNVDIAIDYSTLSSEGKPVSSSGQGLKVVTAKVDIIGKYHNVKSYIKFVENIDFISVEDLMLKQTNKNKLVGTYYINIYYLEQ